MRNTVLLFFLCVHGVSGAETEAVSVTEGDSVTLHSDLTEILNDDTILWNFGPEGTFLSQIKRKANFTSIGYTEDAIFKGRLQVDQNTGSLTIRNTRIKYSGQYQISISRKTSTTKMFNVMVQRVVSGTDGVKSKSLSVMEGESVTIDPDKTQIQGDDLVLWRFGDKGILLAKIDVETKETSLNDADEGFRGRLQLDQTGSLTITNTRTTDSGLYELQIRGSDSLQLFILMVNQRGLSAGAIAAIVIGVALLVAAVGGVIYYLKKPTLREPVSVTEGEDVPLKPNPKINKDDVIQWLLEDRKLQTLIAQIRGEPRDTATYDNAVDGRFRGRLYLDKKTGSLTIKNSRPEHSGLYKLEIISSNGKTSQQRFAVTVNEKVELKEVTDGGSVTLKPATEIQRDDLILWMFGPQHNLIAQIKDGNGKTYYDENRLKLDETTGSLTITKIKDEDSGRYKLLIVSSRGTLYKKFRVFTPSTKTKSLLEKIENESATVEMQPLNEAPDGVNAQEGTSSL